MLLGVAVGQLTGALKGISLPALMGLRSSRSPSPRPIPTRDGATPVPLDLRQRRRSATPRRRVRVDTDARAGGDAAAADGRVRGRRARGKTVPAAMLAARRRAARVPLEYSWSVDDGAVVAVHRDHARGRHRSALLAAGAPHIDVRAPPVGDAGHHRRHAGARRPHRRHRGADRRLRRRRQRAARATPATRSSPAEALQFRFAVDGGAFGPWIVGDHAGHAGRSSTPRTLTVQVRDEAGNIGDLGFHGRTTAPSTGGCSCDLAGRGSSPTARRLLLVGASASRSCSAPPPSGCAASPSPAAPLPVRGRARRRRLLDATSARATSPNPIDEIGRYHDVVFNDGTLYVSAYDDTFGDLVYAEIQRSDEDDPSWQVIDGVDLTASRRHAGRLSPRHQRSRPRRRPLHLDRALDGGDPMIAYFDASNGALKFARGPHPFDVMHRRPAGATTSVDVGLLRRALASTTTACRPSPTSPAACRPGDHFTSELRVATASNDHPAASDWTISTVDIDDDLRAPAAAAAAPPASCRRWSTACPTTIPRSRPAWPSTPRPAPPPAPRRRRASWAPAPTSCSRQRALDLVEGTGLFVQARRNSQGQLVLVYYDHAQGDLKMAVGAPGAWQRLVHRRQRSQRPTSASSPPSRSRPTTACTSPTSTPSTIGLLYKHVAGGAAPPRPTSIDDGTRADGPHSVGGGANLALDGNGNPRVVYQDQQLSDLEVATSGGSWAHQDSRAGIARLRLLPAPALRRRQALPHRVRLRPPERPRARSLGSFQVSVSAP